MVYFPVLWWSCFWKKVVALSVDWYFKYLPNSRNRFKLSLRSQDHFKKKIGTDFFQGIFKCHLGAWWLVVLFDVLLCCQTIYRYRMLNENAFICLMLKNMCSNWYVKWEHSSLCVKMCHYLAGHMKSDLFSRIMATQLNMNAWRNLVCSCNSCCSQSYLALTGWCKSMQFLHTDGYCTTTGRKMLV